MFSFLFYFRGSQVFLGIIVQIPEFRRNSGKVPYAHIPIYLVLKDMYAYLNIQYVFKYIMYIHYVYTYIYTFYNRYVHIYVYMSERYMQFFSFPLITDG
jgi:hypothetical protein